MALRRTNMVAVATGTNTLSLTAPTGKAFRVTNINYWDDTDASPNLIFAVERKRVLQLTAPGAWRLVNRSFGQSNKTIIQKFRDRGLFPVIPVAEGETLTVSGGISNSFTEVVYDEYDAADVKNTERNGSQSVNYLYFNTISNAAAPSANGDLALNASDLDSIFPAFPGGDIVPAKKRILLHGLYGLPVAASNSGAATGHTTRLRLIKDREDILDRDLGGMLFVGDQNHVAPADPLYSADASQLYGAIDTEDKGIVVFEEPIMFEPGEELNVFATIAGHAANGLAIGEVKAGLLLEVLPA